MKYKKPEIVPMFKISSGAAVETLDLWKEAELILLLAPDFAGDGDRELVRETVQQTARYLLDHAEEFVAILGVVERRGRPPGAKDKKPRKRPMIADITYSNQI